MADGDTGKGLTLKDFWKLDKSERAKRYQELSDQDKFGVRISMPPDLNGSEIPCNSCEHYRGYGACDAYPAGIPGKQMDRVDKDINSNCGDGFSYKPGVDWGERQKCKSK